MSMLRFKVAKEAFSRKAVPVNERTDTRGGFHIGSYAGLRYLRTMSPLLQAQSQMK